MKYLGEGPDGADTIDWLRDQPWCDGRVVMTGVSYSAHVQAAAAAEGRARAGRHVQDSGGFSSAYDAGMRMGGAFELKQVTWALRHGRRARRRGGPGAGRAAAAGGSGGTGSARCRGGRAAPRCAHGRRTSEYPAGAVAARRVRRLLAQPAIYGRGYYDRFPDAPTCTWASWYDPYVRSTIENFTAMRRLKSSPAYLVMGPWTHGRALRDVRR